MTEILTYKVVANKKGSSGSGVTLIESTGGGSDITVLKSSDSGDATDNNVLSALRTINEITNRALLKDTDEDTKGIINFLKGLKIGGKIISEILQNTDKDAVGDNNIFSALRVLTEIANRALSKQNDDIAQGLITLIKGLISKGNLQVGDFVSGMNTGQGAQITPAGAAEFESLMLRSFLEVPEIRFNKTTYIAGDNIQSCAGGQIKSVTIDKDSNGNQLQTGTIVLKLEDNEIGEFAVDDIVISIFCNLTDSSQNATTTADDGLGNRTIKGFATSIFRITSVSGTKNETLTYALRATSTNWTTLYHPQALATMAQRGNFTDTTRQAVTIYGICPEPYIRIMHDVNNWEYAASMIGSQMGYMDNLKVLGVDMTGYSGYFKNIYFSGTIEQMEAIAPHMSFDTGGDTFIGQGETKKIVCSVINSYGQDITSTVTAWTVSRDSGHAADDSAWNIAHQSFAGTLSLTLDDLGQNSDTDISTLFTFTAVGATTVTGTLEI